MQCVAGAYLIFDFSCEFHDLKKYFSIVTVRLDSQPVCNRSDCVSQSKFHNKLIALNL